MPVYYKNSKGAGVTAAKWMRGRVVGDYVRKEVGAMSAPPTSEPALSPGPLGPAASCLMTCPPPHQGTGSRTRVPWAMQPAISVPTPPPSSQQPLYQASLATNWTRDQPYPPTHPLQTVCHNTRAHAAYIEGGPRAYSSGDQRGMHCWAPQDVSYIWLILRVSLVPKPKISHTQKLQANITDEHRCRNT